VPALLSRSGIDPVRNNQARRVLKDECGQFERDSVVVALISKILCLVLFILHVVIQIVSCLIVPGSGGRIWGSAGGDFARFAMFFILPKPSFL